MGGAKPRAVVVTVTLAYWPEVIAAGETVQCVAVAGAEHDKFTCAEKPPEPVKEMTLGKVAVWPAVIVAVGEPKVGMEKSVVPVTVKSTAFEVPAP